MLLMIRKALAAGLKSTPKNHRQALTSNGDSGARVAAAVSCRACRCPAVADHIELPVLDAEIDATSAVSGFCNPYTLPISCSCPGLHSRNLTSR